MLQAETVQTKTLQVCWSGTGSRNEMFRADRLLKWQYKTAKKCVVAIVETTCQKFIIGKILATVAGEELIASDLL